MFLERVNDVKENRLDYSTKAAWLSVLFMGLGQLYNKQIIKGIIFILIEAYLLIFASVPFGHSMWGLVTLGTTPQHIEGFDIVPGDQSITLMIVGIIYLVAFLLFIWVYYLNVKDAYKNGKLRDMGMKVNTIKDTYKFMMDKGFPFVLITPALIFTVFLTMLPLLFGILIAFTNYSSPNHLPPKHLVDWVGLQTVIDLFKVQGWSNTFYGVFGWTVIWAILSTFTCFFVGLFFAVIINQQGIVFKKFWRGVFILPWAVPQIISILIMRNMFNETFGPINQYITALGFHAVPWLSDPMAAKILIVTVNIWFGFPYWMVLMSGVMTSINNELYEAADVDGATGFQKFKGITFPIVMFSTAPLLILSFAGNFNNFNIIYMLTGGNPVNDNYTYAGSTDILITWIYKLTLNQGQYNMASVVSILIFIIIAALSIWNFRRTRAFKEEDMMS
jgi:arabinogalactan oligomer / maltooligosaccharide transport system permease protein